MSGMTGHTQQSCDFFVRNPIYETLIRCDWPLFSRENGYFIYYHAFYLPPAVISKLISGFNQSILLWDIILMLWSYAGIVLCLLLLHRRFKNYIFIFLFLWIFFDSFAPFGKKLFDSVAYRIEINNMLQPGAISSWWNMALTKHVGTTSQLYYTYNHAIPIWIIGAWLVSTLGPIEPCTADVRKKNLFSVPLVISLGVLCSPFGSAGILVLTVFLLAAAWKNQPFSLLRFLFSPPMLAGLAIVLCAILYFACSAGGESRMLWSDSKWDTTPDASKRMVSYVLSLACAFVFPLLILRKEYWNSPLGWTAITCAVIFPLTFVGLINNELLFKSSIIFFLCVTCLLCEQWKVSTFKGKTVIVVGVLLTSYSPLLQFINAFSTFGFSKQAIARNVDNSWKGHLNHPHESVNKHVYHQFWGTGIPPFFYRVSGESAHGLLCWCATGNRADTEELPPANHRQNANDSLGLKREPPADANKK